MLTRSARTVRVGRIGVIFIVMIRAPGDFVSAEYYAGGCTQITQPAGMGYDMSHKGGNIIYYGGAGGLILLMLLILFLTGRL